MKWMAFIALLGLIACTEQAATPEKKDDRVVALPLPNSDQITVRLMFRAGSINDPADRKGLTYLTANLVAQGGTQSLEKSEIDELLYPMAVGINFSVDKEATVFATSAHKDNLDKTYEIFRDLLLAPRFDEKDFERIKKNVLKIITEDIPVNNDEVFSKRALDGLMFAGHPYGDLVEGTVSGVEAITIDEVKAHYAKNFTRNNVLIGIAGGYSETFKDTLMADIDKLPDTTPEEVTLPEVPMPDGIVARIVSKERAFGSAIFMGYPLAIDRSSDDFAALMVANSYFGEHRKSYGVLYSKMRSARSLNYGDYSYIEWYDSGHVTQLPFSGTPRRQNFFSIWIRPVQIAEQFAGVANLEQPELGNGHFVIRQSIRELDKLIREGMNQEDFERTRKFLIGYMKLYVQSPSSRLGFLMDSHYYGRTDYINEMSDLLSKLELADVNAAIKKYLQADNFYVAVITDDSEAEKLATNMKTNGSALIVYKPVVKAGLSEEILTEDKEIDQYQLNVTNVEVVENTTMFKN